MAMNSLLHDLEAGLEYSEHAASYIGELVGEPSEERDSSEGDDADVELPAELIGFGVSKPAEDGVAVHLG